MEGARTKVRSTRLRFTGGSRDQVEPEENARLRNTNGVSSRRFDHGRLIT